MKRYNFPFKIYLLLIFLMAISTYGFGQIANNGDKIKSQMLISLTQNIEWPQNKSKITLGLLGENKSIPHNLEQIIAKRFHSKTLEVVVFTSAFDVRGCDILYVTHEGIEEALLLSDSVMQNTLVISDTDMGCAMAFDYEAGKLSLRVNEEVLSKTPFSISRNFMAIAAR